MTTPLSQDQAPAEYFSAGGAFGFVASAGSVTLTAEISNSGTASVYCSAF